MSDSNTLPIDDRFRVCDHARLLQSLLTQVENGGEVLGIPRAAFFTPSADDSFASTRYGRRLETPVGVAAGPHAQLARNLVAAWLCGSRYFELKTVQVLDELDITKPCIDMTDEGYNCEWSQELNLEESFDEYLYGLLSILALRHKLNQGLDHPNASDGRDPGFVFNMSAGYDLAGITSAKMVRFLDRMQHCPDEIHVAATRLAAVYPPLADITLPDGVSDNLTISTMHGCPPSEVEAIARHFIEDRGLHTTLKLNPTLLGPERVRSILGDLGWKTTVPDAVFAHDLTLDVALPIIDRLQSAAGTRGVDFNLKLTNTLPCENDSALPGSEEQVYLSGRPLHPLAVNVGALLRDNGVDVDLSFCAGADCFNTPALMAAGLGPVTTCSDLLRPGGYARLRQYVDELAKNPELTVELAEYAHATTRDPRYAATTTASRSLTPARPLPESDCFVAPCRTFCPASQEVPDYLQHLAGDDATGALDVIHQTNPLARTLGMACDARCHKACTRADYDAPLAIRAAKAHAAAASAEPAPPQSEPTVAVHGADARAAACAGTLARAGVAVVLVDESLLSDKRTKLTQAIVDDMAACGVRVAAQAAPDLAAIEFSKPLPTGPGALPAAVAEGRSRAEAWLVMNGMEPDEKPARKPARPMSKTLREARTRRRFASDDMAQEAARCLHCDVLCETCVSVCPNRAIIAVASCPHPLVQGRVEGTTVEVTGQVRLRDATQIFVLADHCNACANCTTFCPSAGAPYTDKPRIHLNAEGLAREGRGLHRPDAQTLQVDAGRITREGDVLVYSAEGLRVELDAATLAVRSAKGEGNTSSDLGAATRAAGLFVMLADCEAIA